MSDVGLQHLRPHPRRGHKSISHLLISVRTATNPDLIHSLVSEAASSIRRLPHHRPLFRLAVSRLSRFRRPDLVANLLSLPPPPSTRPTDSFLARTISLFSAAGMPYRAAEVFHSSTIPPADKSFSALLSAHVKHRFDLGRIRETFDRATETLGIKPGIVHYNLLLRGLCQNGELDSAQQVLDEMPKRGIEPDIVSYNALLEGFLKKGDDAGFEDALRLISDNDLDANVFTYNCRIKSACEKGKSFRGEELLDVMVKKGLKPDRMSFLTVINGFCQEGDVDAALRVFKRMRKALTNDGKCDVRPGSQAIHVLLKGLVEKGDHSMAFLICRECLGQKLTPPFDVVKGLVDGLVKESKVREVKAIVEKMSLVAKGEAAAKEWNKIKGDLAL